MNLTPRFSGELVGQTRPAAKLHQIVVFVFIQQPINQAAQDPLRKPFCRRINRSDAPEMNRDFVVVFDHLKLRMLHAEPLPTLTRLPENDQPLSGQNHLLNVMKIEPAQNERLAEGVRIVFLQRRLEDLLPRPKRLNRVLITSPQRQIGLIAFFLRKAGELASDLRTVADNG